MKLTSIESCSSASKKINMKIRKQNTIMKNNSKYIKNFNRLLNYIYNYPKITHEKFINEYSYLRYPGTVYDMINGRYLLYYAYIYSNLRIDNERIYCCNSDITNILIDYGTYNDIKMILKSIEYDYYEYVDSINNYDLRSFIFYIINRGYLYLPNAVEYNIYQVNKYSYKYLLDNIKNKQVLELSLEKFNEFLEWNKTRESYESPIRNNILTEVYY